MKKALLILLLSLFSGVIAFCVMRHHRMSARADAPLLDSLPELAWLKSDLHLNNEQFAKVSGLHAAYRPKCVELCHCMEQSHAKLSELSRKERGVTPELMSAIEECAQVRSRCQAAMLNHLYETASVLAPDQATRYLTTMLPYALNESEAHDATGHSH